MPERDYHWLGVVWAVGTDETCHPGPNWRSLIMWSCPVVNSPVFLLAVWPSCSGLLCRRGVQVIRTTFWSCSLKAKTAVHMFNYSGIILVEVIVIRIVEVKLKSLLVNATVLPVLKFQLLEQFVWVVPNVHSTVHPNCVYSTAQFWVSFVPQFQEMNIKTLKSFVLFYQEGHYSCTTCTPNTVCLHVQTYGTQEMTLQYL